MASETIIVYIDPTQVRAQKKNNYSLYLAKMVNGQFTVIWQSKGPITTVDGPSYEYMNQFDIAVPSYQVNYGTLATTNGSVTFTAAGLAQDIEIGQTVELDDLGLFGTPTNTGTAGEITIHNDLQGNPIATLLDSTGNPIFVNTQSGMDTGNAYITPIDTYQIWFDNYQDTGTIIAHNVSNVATVTFSGGTIEKVVSYTSKGVWQDGPLAAKIDLTAVAGLGQVADPIIVSVLAAFKYALTAGALTYLLNNLINKFSNNLRPTKIKGGIGSAQVLIEFAGPQNREILAAFGTDKFEQAANLALTKAKADPAFGLKDESWTLSEPTLTVTY